MTQTWLSRTLRWSRDFLAARLFLFRRSKYFPGVHFLFYSFLHRLRLLKTHHLSNPQVWVSSLLWVSSAPPVLHNITHGSPAHHRCHLGQGQSEQRVAGEWRGQRRGQGRGQRRGRGSRWGGTRRRLRLVWRLERGEAETQEGPGGQAAAWHGVLIWW